MVWGSLNGLFQIVGDWLRPVRKALLQVTGLDTDTLGHKAVQVVCTTICVDLAWVFFRANRLMDGITIIRSIFTATNVEILFDGSLFLCGLDEVNFLLLLVYIGVLFVSDLCKYKHISIRQGIARQSWLCQVLVVTFGVLAILLLGVYGPGFEASNFIYSQF